MNLHKLQTSDLRSHVLLAAERAFAEDGLRGASVGRICELADISDARVLRDEFGQQGDLRDALISALIESRLMLLNEVRWTIVDHWQEVYQADTYHRDSQGCLDYLAEDCPLTFGELLYTAFYPLCWYIFQSYPHNYWSTFLLQYNIRSPNAIFSQSTEPWFSSLLYCINYAEKKLSPVLEGDGEEAMERIYLAAHQLQSLFALEESGLRSGSTGLEEAKALSLRVIQAAGRQLTGGLSRLEQELELPDEEQRQYIDCLIEQRKFRMAVPRWKS